MPQYAVKTQRLNTTCCCLIFINNYLTGFEQSGVQNPAGLFKNYPLTHIDLYCIITACKEINFTGIELLGGAF